MDDMAGSWQVIATTCHGVFGSFMQRTEHNGRYGSLFQNFNKGRKRREQVIVDV
jgi:hypothetical protein